jgi:hypothetical protein
MHPHVHVAKPYWYLYWQYFYWNCRFTIENSSIKWVKLMTMNLKRAFAYTRIPEWWRTTNPKLFVSSDVPEIQQIFFREHAWARISLRGSKERHTNTVRLKSISRRKAIQVQNYSIADKKLKPAATQTEPSSLMHEMSLETDRFWLWLWKTRAFRSF